MTRTEAEAMWQALRDAGVLVQIGWYSEAGDRVQANRGRDDAYRPLYYFAPDAAATEVVQAP